MKAKQFNSLPAWKYCSKYVLLYYSDGLYTKCATCGTTLKINEKNTHCGHWIKTFDGSKTNFATAFEFENLAPQCYQCNVKKGGCQLEMQEWLESKHGKEAIEKLKIKRHNICKLDGLTIHYWRAYYKGLFDDLVKEKGNPWK